MSTDPNIHPYWAAETKQLASRLDEMDYFQILGCTAETPLAEIKAQYHALQRAYHPDTFYQSPDLELKQAVFLIAKRVAEAYVILRDSLRREKYVRDITGPEREKKLRYNEESEREVRKERVEAEGRTPQGRKLVTKALASLSRGDLAGAARDLQTALLFEAGNETIKNRLEQIQEQITASKKKK